jgi:hypothetical protein
VEVPVRARPLDPSATQPLDAQPEGRVTEAAAGEGEAEADEAVEADAAPAGEAE